MPDFDPDAYLKDVTQAAAQPDDKAFDPDSYMDGELKKYVDDDTFDPLVLATEQPDKLAMAKEIEWRKSQRPMTGARAGQVAKNVVRSVPGIIKDFGAGAGAIAGDAIIQATDETPANVERAKTQQLARAQLIEQHGGGFMNKLLGPDSWFGKHFNPSQQDLIKSGASANREGWEKYAANSPDKPAALAAIDQKEKDALAAVPPPESPRQVSDRQFEEKLAQVKRERELLKGIPQSDGLVAGVLKTTGDAVRELATGEQPHDDQMDVTNTFKSGPELEKMGAPVDPEAIRTGAVTADPVNLLPLHVPGMTKVAGKIGGALLKAPAAIAEKVAENTPQAVSNVLKKKVLGTAVVAGGGALTAEAIHDPAGAAKMLAAAGIATAGLAGARYFGRVMDTAGSKLLDPKFVSAAERAGAESAMNIEKAGGGQLSKFLDPAMNKADFERALVKPIQSGVTAPIAMAPLNVALSDTPEEFGSLTGTAMGFGAFSGATAYNPLKGFHPETVAAVDSILRDNGAKKKYGTALDAQHNAFMADAPEGVRDAVNSYRGFFDGFKMPNGREPQIYVLPAAEFGAEVNKRRPDVTPEHAAKQRGFAGKDGAILINGDYGGEAPGILGHEAGGHVAQSIMEVLAPEVAKSMDAAALKGLTDAKGKPTPKLKAFVDAYNKEFDPTGKTKEIQTTDHAISEWLAEQGRAVLEGQGPAKFAAGESVRANIGDNLADQFRKIFGTKRMFDRSEVPALARQYRDLLFQLGRFRTQEGPQTAPPEAAPAPGDPAAAPAGAAPAAEPAAPATGDRATGDRATVAAALRSLFGVKQAEADAMAAAATGSTVEEMIASAAQAKSKAVAGSRTTAPAAQPAPLQPAGQLAGVAAAAEPAAAPAAQLAGFGEPAAAPKAKIFVRRLPDGTFVDRQGNPVDPRTGVAPEAPNLDRGGAAAPPEAPARPVVTPEDLTSRVQAAEDAARADEATKKRRNPASREKATAQAVKEARIKALLDAAHETAPDEGHLQRREEFGTTSYTGRIDESIPAHRMLLDELGVSEGGRSNIDTLSANLGKPVFIRYKSAAKEGSSEAAQASGQVDRTGKQRAKEYKAESVDSRIEDAQAGDVNTGVEQTKSFYPLGFRVNPSTGSVTVTGFSPQRLLANVGKIVEFMRGKGRDTGYSGPDDPAIHDDMQGYAQNHANGYKGDGSGPIEGETPNSHYEPHVIDSTRFDLLNAAMGNESAKTPKSDREGAKARAGDLQDFAAANDTLVTPEGETNPLRQWLNDNGFEFKNEAGETRTGTKEILEPTVESLRVDPELMRDISTEAPEGESSLRPTGVADPSAMTAQGIPKARNVAAGFMPGNGEGQLGDFGKEKDEPSIESKVRVPPWERGPKVPDSKQVFEPLRDKIKDVAQEVYDAWDASDPEHGDAEVGFGGICQDIADNMAGVLNDHGIEAYTQDNGGMGEQHVWVIAKMPDGVWEIDIPPSVYETGGGYNWKKIEGVKFGPDDVVIHRLDADPDSIGQYIEGYQGDDQGESDGGNFMPGNRGAEQAAGGGKRQLEDFGPVNSLGFYSGLRQTVDKKVPNRATVEQVKRTLDPANGGAKKEELEALGLPQFLDGKTHVTKQELLDFIDTHGVDLKEVEKRSGFTEEQQRQFQELVSERAQQVHDKMVADKIEALIDRGYDPDEIDETDVSNDTSWDDAEFEAHEQISKEQGHTGDDGDETLFSQYQLERSVGENYKELNYVLPNRDREVPVKVEKTPSGWNVEFEANGQTFKTDVPNNRASDRVEAERYARGYFGARIKEGEGDQNYTVPSSHQYGDDASDTNRLYHTRQADHTDTEGKRVRMVEEWQSDWHQTGREQGYKETSIKPDKEKAAELVAQANAIIGDRHVWELSDSEKAEYNRLQGQAHHAAIPGKTGVPDAPFKKSWHELAFKKSLGDAVRDGMDKLAWTTGAQQAERYDLSKQLDSVRSYKSKDGTYSIQGMKDGEVLVAKSDLDEAGLAANVGKELAQKIIAGEGTDIGKDSSKRLGREDREFSGIDLKVGGEGMQGFYDNIMVKFANKYLKPWGVKVEKTVLPRNGGISGNDVMEKLGIPAAEQKDYWRNLEMEERNRLLEDYRKDGETVHSVTITPELREAISKGQPMFMPGKGPEKAAGDLSDFGKDESSIESKVEWEQPKRAKAAGDVVVQVKTSAFDEAFQKDHGFYIDKDGNGEIKGRRERFKEFLKEGKAIEMPEVVITKEGTAAFVNGRHRFSVMRDSGVESMPMSMDETSALRAQTLGMTVEGKSEGGDLGSFMPSDATGRGEFEVKEKKPVDERRVRLMADMQNQAKWLTAQAKELGFDSPDDLAAEDFDAFNRLAKQWREENPRHDDAGNQLFMPGQRPEDVFMSKTPSRPAPSESSEPSRTWFVRGGQRVYHHRGEAGKFAQKPTLARFGASAISQDDEDEKAQLKAFK